MVWERLRRWLRGYVTFEGEGGSPERLTRLARQAGVGLWDTRLRPFSLSSRCAAADYRRLRVAVRHSGIRLRLRGKRGFPFAVRGYRGRYGLAVGAVLAVVLWTVLPGRVWVVSVEGNETVPSARIAAVAEELGVAVGAQWDALDIPALRLQALTKLPELAWITVNPEGSVAHVLVKERTEGTLPDAENAPSDLVAACDGVIRRVVAWGGFPQVKPGEAVTVGDVLVTGVYESRDYREFWDYTRAKGEVWAETEHTVTVNVPLTETALFPTGEQRVRWSFRLLGWQVPLYTASPLPGTWQIIEQERCLTARGLTLPLGFTERVYVACAPQRVVRTEAEAMALARQETAVRFVKQYPTAAVIKQQETAAVLMGVCRLETVFTCEENIAREVPLVVPPRADEK